MAQSGGSATIYGILYQILGSLDWAVGLRLQDAVVEDGELLQARLIVEPAGGGGDLQVKLPGGMRIVEQWKSRRTRKQWTVKELIADVLPDLYLAVPWPETPGGEVYRFVTEGKRSVSYEKTLGFFRELRDLPVPEAPFGSLDDKDVLLTLDKKRLTRRKLSECITQAVRKRKVVRDGEDEARTRQKLWHLLGRFEMPKEVSGASLRANIDSALRPLADFQDHIASKREQLCGLLLEIAGEGEVSLTITEFLQRAELDVLSLRDHGGIQRALGSLLDRELRNSGYEPKEDVRRSPVWPEGSPVLAFSGESGQGKTWQLARLRLLPSGCSKPGQGGGHCGASCKSTPTGGFSGAALPQRISRPYTRAWRQREGATPRVSVMRRSDPLLRL